MSRFSVWLTLSGVGLSYLGVVYDFAPSAADHFAGPAWFGGMALALHWYTNSSRAT